MPVIDLSRVWSPQQYAEVRRYDDAYQDPEYRMGSDRFGKARALIGDAPRPEALLLDVSCGRGEVVDWAPTRGWVSLGTEVVDALVRPPAVVRAKAWCLPFGDGGFDTVTCFDVLEHLLPGDDEPTVREMARVSARRILLTIGLYPSAWLGCGELHANLRPEAEWSALLAEWLPGWRVARRSEADSSGINAAWEAIRG